MLDHLSFLLVRQRNRARNTAYLQKYPGLVIPPDKDLHETYRLDYRKFIEDGSLAAKEILEWTKPYLPAGHLHVLEWGCGTGRIIRHLPELLADAALYGCDISEGMIAWNKMNARGISFTVVNSFPPTCYAPDFFELVYGFSVLTHIDASRQSAWIGELHRILAPQGIALLTTHGSRYHRQLLPFQKSELERAGVFTRQYPQQGRRMMATYVTGDFFRSLLEPHFTVLEWFEGSRHPGKIGGQDLWILQKKR